MAILEVVVLALKFLFTEFPLLLDKYKLYRKDKNYKNKKLAYEEAMRLYTIARRGGKHSETLRQLRALGKR